MSTLLKTFLLLLTLSPAFSSPAMAEETLHRQYQICLKEYMNGNWTRSFKRNAFTCGLRIDDLDADEGFFTSRFLIQYSGTKEQTDCFEEWLGRLGTKDTCR